VLVLGVLAAVTLAGCAVAAPTVQAPPLPDAGAGEVVPPDSPNAGAGAGTVATDYPTCDAVYAAMGAEASDLVLAPDADNGEVDGSAGRELSCTWVTPQAIEGSLDLQNYGGFSVGVHRDPTYVESDYDALGWTIDDPRLDADDAWALTAGGQYDPGAVVDIGSVQVVRDGTVVTLSAAGGMLNDVPQLADLTQSWALGAGLRILDLTR
jgi:hypothetical protein